jgi:hypothetical protein
MHLRNPVGLPVRLNPYVVGKRLRVIPLTPIPCSTSWTTSKCVRLLPRCTLCSLRSGFGAWELTQSVSSLGSIISYVRIIESVQKLVIWFPSNVLIVCRRTMQLLNGLDNDAC